MGVISGTGQAVGGLGGAAGYGETALSRGDDVYFQLDLSAVFGSRITTGGLSYASTSVYLSTDGYITFGQAPMPSLPPDPLTLNIPFIAPFMADIDTRLDGEGPESGPIWLDIDPSQGVVTITWQDVGFYRRNASLTNTFQLQLFDRGNGNFDTVFRYDHINWVSGDLQYGYGGLGGTAAFVGFKNAGTTQALAASGNETSLLNLASTLGNTGQAGLWVYSPAISIRVDGTSGADTVCGTIGSDTLNGFGGDDVFMGSGGADLIDGGIGFDSIDYSRAGQAIGLNLLDPNFGAGDAAGDQLTNVELVTATQYQDTLLGDGANNVFFASFGFDTLFGGDGADSLYGGGDGDWLDGGAGADFLNGGDGLDIAAYNTATSGVLVDLSGVAPSAGAAFGDTFSQIEVIISSAFNDTLIGDAADNRLFSGEGIDVLFGGAGNDVLSGGAGIDYLNGGVGADSLIGGDGFDIVTYLSALSAVRLDLANPASSTGDAAGDVLSEVESVRGTLFNDVMIGDAAANILRGDLGNDSLYGGVGADSLVGGEGDDLIEGGEGADFLNGHNGIDRVNYQSATTGVTLDLMNPALNTGAAFGDMILNFEVFVGSLFSDTLSGDALANSLFGLAGDDVLSGMAGNDTLRGGPGTDLLFGGDGADCFIFSVGAGMPADSIGDYAFGAGDTLEINTASMVAQFPTLSQFSAVSSNIPNLGSAAIADVTLRYIPTNQIICTLTDLGSGSTLSLHLNGNEYFLSF